VIYEPVILPALSPVAASHDAATGRIEAAWTVSGDLVTYDIVVPAGAIGTLVLAPSYSEAMLDGKLLPPAAAKEKTRSPLAPGSHKVTFRISRS
jgi:alpha-L-rhamnosidase